MTFNMIYAEAISSSRLTESDLPGQIYSADEVAANYFIHHTLDDIAKIVSPAVHADYVLA